MVPRQESNVTTVDDDRDQTEDLKLKVAYFIIVSLLWNRDLEFPPTVFYGLSE